MTIVTLFDVVALIGSMAALAFLLAGRRKAPSDGAWFLFFLVVLLTVSRDCGNFLEWAGITSWFDPIEDYIEILIATLWVFFFNTYSQGIAEKALRLSEEKYRRLFEVGNDAIFVFEMEENDQPGVFIDVNDIACQRLEYTKEELLRMRMRDLNDPSSATDRAKTLETLIKQKRIVYERIHVSKGGRKIPVEISSRMFELFDKRVVVCIARDISQRIESERKIRELQELDDKILESSPVAFVIGDREGRVLRVSRAFGKITGLDPDSVVGKRPEDFMPQGPARDALMERIRKVSDEGARIGPVEVMIPLEEPRWIRETTLPIFNQEGRVINNLSVLEDITAEMETQRKLKEIMELDEKILAASPVAFVLHDRDLRVIRVSRAYQDVTGFLPEQVVGKTIFEFMPKGPQRDKIIENLEKVLEFGIQAGPEDIHAPIPGRFIRETILPVFGQEGGVVNVLSVLEDITERKREADERRKSDQKYQLLFENIQDGIVLNRILADGKAGNFIQANAAFHKLTGYGREELLELSPMDITDRSEREDFSEIRATPLPGSSTFFERVLRTKEGGEVLCEIRSDTLELGDEKVVLSVCHDVTQRVMAERKMRASLEEKEVLLREIHHRVKNNLQVISGLLNLQSYFIDDESVRNIHKESQNRIKTMAIIHEELYQRDDLAFVNLPQYIGELAGNLFSSHAVKKNKIRLVQDIEDIDLVLDTAVPCGLIVNELLSNCLKHAFPERRKGEVRITFKQTGERKFFLAVSDNGIGLPADFDLDNVRSMGIQLVRILAEQLGGELQSKAREGTAFQIEFNEYHEAGTVIHGSTDSMP